MRRMIVLTALALTSGAVAHPGGLAADGCHNDRKNGGRHCHGSGSSSSGPSSSSSSSSSSRSKPVALRSSGGGGAFRNCTVARAAGAAPVRVGDAGYGAHLDRDGDGVGCE